MSVPTLPEHIDPNKLAHTLWLRRKDLRELPLAIDISLGLTRDMLTELFFDDEHELCNHKNIHAVLRCAQGCADKLYDTLTALIGEDDESVKETRS